MPNYTCPALPLVTPPRSSPSPSPPPVYFPAAWACARVFCRGCSPSHRTFTLAALLLQPALVIVDHGHFQYNCIGLGLAAGAAAAIGGGRKLLGSFLFCLSLNHKQMGLFFAPAFFAHLLGWCLQQRTMTGKASLCREARYLLLRPSDLQLLNITIWSPCRSSVYPLLLSTVPCPGQARRHGHRDVRRLLGPVCQAPGRRPHGGCWRGAASDN